LNFKLLLIIALLQACGVKSPPRNTSSIVFKSYSDEYYEEQLKTKLQQDEDSESESSKKKNKKK
jgi:hypothetical protein